MLAGCVIAGAALGFFLARLSKRVREGKGALVAGLVLLALAAALGVCFFAKSPPAVLFGCGALGAAGFTLLVRSRPQSQHVGMMP